MRNLMMFALLVVLLVAAQYSKAQTADEIVEKYIAAIGGQEKMLALNSVKMEGSLSMQGMDIGITNTSKHGVGNRIDISVPGMGEGYRIVTKTKGWNYMPFQGQTSPEEMSEDELKAGQAQLDVQGPLVNYKAKGNKIELLPNEKVDNEDCYKIKVTSPAGRIITLFISTKTLYRLKAVTVTQTPDGEKQTETTYSDFKKNADGYLFAYSQTSANGTMIFTTIETNKAVDDKLFEVN
jgi:hypothetical protein